MALREAIIRAEHASNLAEHTGHVQILRAVGAAAVPQMLGGYLARALSSGGMTTISHAARELDAAAQRAFPQVGEAERFRTALGSVLVFLNPVCGHCQGRKFQRIPGTTSLSDQPCEACAGKGSREVEVADELQPLARWMLGMCDQAVYEVGRATGRKLGRGR